MQSYKSNQEIYEKPKFAKNESINKNNPLEP